MGISVEQASGYRFGAFILDAERGALRGPDGEIRLRRKSFLLLLYMVRNPGRLLSRDELFNAIWGHTAVTDDSLTQCLVEIRRALGDESRQVVRTVPRRGYLFDEPVTPLAGEVPTPAAPVRNLRWSVLAGASAVAGAIIVLVMAWWLLDSAGPQRANVPGAAPRDVPASAVPASAIPVSDVPVVPNSIAVLPFVDMSADQDQEYFGDGIAEEILNLLTRVEGLKVIARTSSFSFKGRQADIKTIASWLGVEHVLEGSVRKSGNRVRVTAQLVSASDSAHLWSEAYERELTDIFAVQVEIATSVAEVLAARLRGDARTTTRDPRAFDHYLRGRFLFHRRGTGDLEWAQQHFHAATGFDPAYAPAWAALAGFHFIAATESADAGGDLEIALSYVERALALDPKLPEAHLRAAAIYGLHDDADRAAHHFEVATSLDPDNPLLLGNLAGGALARGDLDAAIQFNQRALARDPLSTVSRLNFASTLLAAGRLEEAHAQYLAALEINPVRSHEVEIGLARMAILEGHFAAAVNSLERLPASVERDGVLAIALVAAGRGEEAAALATSLAANGSYASAALLADYFAFQGEAETAWSWLELARERLALESLASDRRWRQLTLVSPFLRPLHGDPRWAAMYDVSR